MRISSGTTRSAITILAVVGLAGIVLMGADYAVDTTGIWVFLRSAPSDFTGFIKESLDDYRFWSVVVIVGLVSVIAFIQKVPMIKGR